MLFSYLKIFGRNILENILTFDVVHCLGGKESNAYRNKSIRSRVYIDIHRQLRREFGVDTYKAIKRSQCHLAVSVIESYTLPLVLEAEIENENNQLNLDTEVA